MDSKYVQQFKKGSLEMILLCLINEKDHIFGYAKEGTIYPILYRLEAAEMISCKMVKESKGTPKKMYSLTAKGKETLDELKAFWNEYVTCVNHFIEGE